MPDWSMWFEKDGDPRHGTADDPRMVLIGVDVHSAVYLEVNKPQPVVLYEIAKGFITGTEPKIGEMHTVDQGTPGPGAWPGTGTRAYGIGLKSS